ncbi:MAG: nucleotide exchange factor GrpE [Candidatus Kryptonium sp.]|nr:nucleotide exchange factor GrpE [Candidatus Kryptonium sp.]MDW8108784.1 nucleotide exchange factor GrpE [Candidatus Kryptonium sp.]
MTENEKVRNTSADEEMKSVEQSASEAKTDESSNSTVGTETLDELTLLKIENENLRKEIDEYKDRLLRRVAEFENYKKRLEADFANSVKYANEKLLLEILPIVDDLERSLSSGKEKPDFDSFYQGVKMIYTKLLKVLELHGVKPFESIGKPFDVYYHEALLRIPRNDVPPNTVIDEVERGYMYYDKVLRHAKVIVSSPVEDSEKKEGNEKDSGLKTDFSDDHREI